MLSKKQYIPKKEFKAQPCSILEQLHQTIREVPNKFRRSCSDLGTKPLLIATIVLLTLNLVSLCIPAPSSGIPTRRRLPQIEDEKIPDIPIDSRGWRKLQDYIKTADENILSWSKYRAALNDHKLNYKSYYLTDIGDEAERANAHFMTGIEETISGLGDTVNRTVKDLLDQLSKDLNLGDTLNGMMPAKYPYGERVMGIVMNNLRGAITKDVLGDIKDDILQYLVKGDKGVLCHAFNMVRIGEATGKILLNQYGQRDPKKGLVKGTIQPMVARLGAFLTQQVSNSWWQNMMKRKIPFLGVPNDLLTTFLNEQIESYIDHTMEGIENVWKRTPVPATKRPKRFFDRDDRSAQSLDSQGLHKYRFDKDGYDRDGCNKDGFLRTPRDSQEESS